MIGTCSRCGARYDVLDAKLHTCNPADVPARGRAIRSNGTEVVLE